MKDMKVVDILDKISVVEKVAVLIRKKGEDVLTTDERGLSPALLIASLPVYALQADVSYIGVYHGIILIGGKI